MTTGRDTGSSTGTGAPGVLERARSRVRRPAPGVVLLGLLAYVPALTAAPGRMPADSKLYLYLDPQRLVSDAFHSFDPRQFAGWVPHQHIAYLWPSGPWFGAFEIVGVPDWIAHRLWIGTLLFAAGLGVRWAAGLLGLTAAGAIAAAVVYQCSPYLLPYVSRTSVMLLPWAGLGWIVGLTVLATLRTRWRHAALLALVVLTVGAVNATALMMIVPAPALWLVHAVVSGVTTWRRAAATAARVAVLCAVVSLWWVVALVLQGRHGPDVLAYSETLEAVSFTSLSSEVVRGLGYWLFYVRDPYAATTTAAADHLVSGRTVAIGLLLVVVCLVGLVVTSWSQRRYAVWLVVVGVVLAVGVHPIDRPSPLMSLLTGDGTSGLALALRSSTRAVPVSLFGLALGAGALVSALRTHRWRRRRDVEHLAAAAIVVLAVVGLPALRTGGLVDPALERDHDPPAAWLAAARDLDTRAGGHRVLQIPGAEFGSFRWGHTVDQPLPGIADTPLVTRDLLPLGSPAAMDLLYAFDDRIQRGVLEPDSIAPVARLFGAATVWLANDVAYDRYRTPRPDVVAAALAGGAAGLAPPRSFGEPTPNVPAVAMVDEQAIALGPVPAPLPPVQLLDVDDPAAVVRAKQRMTVLAGDGEGIVDAAAAGLVDGSELVRYAASLDDDELRRAVADASLLVVTDTNRPRARHWRGSQDAVGFTEDGTDRPALTRPADGDARFEFLDHTGPAHRTTAEQRGPVTARASAYGEPFAYRPERRAAMAVDGDPTTAWTVADRFDAVGEHLELELAAATDRLVLLQPEAAPGARRISDVDVSVDGGPAHRVALDERSLEPPGQPLELAGVTAGSLVTLTIAATSAEAGHPDAHAAVGFAEVDAGLGPTTEVVRVPTAALAATTADTPLAVVLTRERVRPTDRWRSDPEPFVRRELTLPHPRTFEPTVTVRLDQRAPDTVLADLLGVPGATASARLTGSARSAGWAALDGRDDTAWTSPFGSAVGASLTVAVGPSAGSAPIELRQPVDGLHSAVTGLRVTDDLGGILDVALAADPDGVAVVDVGSLGGSQWTFEITSVDARETVDRRYGEPTALPIAISRLEGPGLPVVTVPATLDTGCRDDLVDVDGTGVALRVRADVGDLLAGDEVLAEPCDGPLALAAGVHTLTTSPGQVTGLQVDRIVLADHGGAPLASSPPGTGPEIVVTESSRTSRSTTVDGCADGCWVVLGEGHNPAWAATADGRDLGDPELVDGGFNGWWLEPGPSRRSVEFTWTPQPLLTAGLAASAAGAVLCVALVVLDRRRRPLPVPDRPAPLARGRDRHRGRVWRRVWRRLTTPATSRTAIAAVGAAWVAVAALVIAPVWALAPLPVIAAMLVVRSARPAGWVALVLAAAGAALMVSRVVRWRPAPDAAWVLRFEDLHRPGLFVVTALLASALLRDRSLDPEPQPAREGGSAPTAPPA